MIQFCRKFIELTWSWEIASCKIKGFVSINWLTSKEFDESSIETNSTLFFSIADINGAFP